MSRIFSIIAIALATLALVANVQADVIKVYDFDTNVGQTLTVGGKLIGQDNWVNLATHDHATVATGETIFSGNYAQAGTFTANSDTQAGRTNDLNWSYSIPAHTEFDVSAVIYSPGYSGYGATVGFQPSTTTGGYTGLVFGTNAGTYLRWFNNASAAAGGKVAELSISGITAQWLVGVHVKWDSDTSTYKGQAYYQNITSAGDKTDIGNVFTLPAASDPTTWNALYWRLGSPVNPTRPLSKIDDITITYVPEPGTLALLAAGLVGMIAYAWRKRK